MNYIINEYANNIWYPIIFTIAYFTMIITCKSPNWNIPRWIVSVWNVFLSVYSGISLWYLMPIVYYWWNSLTTFDDFVCVEHRQSFDPTLGYRNIVYIFCLSKVIELLDTFFIVSRNRYPIFLHWFHHVLTMWYCWYAITPASQNNYIFCIMNLFVHSIMYMYYAMVGYFKFLRPIGPCLTIIQTTQMVFGSTLLAYQNIQIFQGRPTREYHDAHNYRPELKETCHIVKSEVYFASFMYLVYLYLFGVFLVNIVKTRWCGKKEKFN